MKREKELYLEWCLAEKDLQDISLEAYSHDLDLFFEYLKEWKIIKIEQLREYHVESWLALCHQKYHHEKTITLQTCNRRRGSMRRFIRFLYNEEMCGIDPDLIMGPQTTKWLPHSVITEEQVQALLAQPKHASLLGIRDAAMLELCYASGLRVTELITLTSSQIKRGWVEIRGKRNKERKVPYSEKAHELIQEYLRRRGDLNTEYVFLSSHKKPMTRQNFWGRIKKYAKAAGIEKNISPHTLRHAFATHMLNRDVSLRHLQIMMGHSSISTTELYLAVAKKRLIMIHQKHHPRGGKS